MSFMLNRSDISSQSVVCIVSGGLDSICTCAYLRKQNFSSYMVTFSYDQRAIHELEYAKKFSGYLNFKEHKIVDISFTRNKRYGT